ncbi:hypothetical protein TNCV_2980721 [Trichonephila clavipes]|nr:hypothetical protein TNCV_2980721 [Trichonephila clavipes]
MIVVIAEWSCSQLGQVIGSSPYASKNLSLVHRLAKSSHCHGLKNGEQLRCCACHLTVQKYEAPSPISLMFLLKAMLINSHTKEISSYSVCLPG